MPTLLSDLRRNLRGAVHADLPTRTLYARDASNYHLTPLAVVAPRDADDLLAALAVCRHHDAAVLPRGAGTSLAGQAANAAVVLDFTRHMNRLLEIDPVRRTARVQPGVVLDDLRRAAERHGLTFGPDPATHGWCTLGGMIGNNACGVHSLAAGRTSDNVHRLDVVTYRGDRFSVGATPDERYAEIVAAGGPAAEIHRRLRDLAARCGDEVRRRYPPIPRRVSGFNLDDLLPENGFHVARALTGSEGTCAVVVEATVHLVPAWPHRALVAVAYADPFAAADHVPEVLAAEPIGLEGLDARLVEGARLPPGAPPPPLPAGGGWLLAELGGDDATRVEADARALAERLRGAAGVEAVEVVAEPAAQARLWELREAALAATARTPEGRPTHPGWEDTAVAPERLGGYLRDLAALLDRHGLSSTFYGHFGDGCVHSKIDFDLASEAGRTVYRRFLDEAVDLVVRHGGVASGEHGDGQARGELLGRLYGAEIVDAMRRFKAIWDPDGRMNPGKVVDARPILADLRAAGPPPAEPETAFAYADDGGRFSRAVGRCVGVGRCVRLEGGTMCPSYRATHDERHSTRGRAHLLDAMLRGELGGGGDLWADRDVHAALGLCLACKACKSECPAGVDMATYKAEFLHRFHRHHRRPRAAWALGRVATWARWAAKAPRLANAALALPGASHLAKLLAGIAPERPLPRFAPRGLRRRLEERPRRDDGRPVLLWLDTFNQHFTPEIGVAAAEVLQAAGFAVRLPPDRPLCCGRPLFDFGWLDLARRRLAAVLDALAPEIAAGTPVVVLEPSCTAVFRDELPALFPDDPRAGLLSRLVTGLGELLGEEAVALPTRLEGTATFHGHCHQRALTGTEADVALLRRLGLTVETPDTGCCGMAGAFGYERSKYDVSVAVAELALLPALRAAPADALVIADGFSCRRQIEDLGGRRAWHLAEVVRAGLQ